MNDDQLALLIQELRSLLARSKGRAATATAPEFVSGNPLSPLWFLAINAAGGGSRPTWETASDDPSQYLDYYLGRYAGLSFTSRPPVDSRGLKVKATAWAFMRYVQAFAEGLGRPQDAAALLFKTNRYGAQTKNVKDLRKLADPIDLSETVRRLAGAYSPPVIVGFGAEPYALLARIGPCLENPKTQDLRKWDGVKPLRLTFPGTAAHIFSQERAALMREVGYTMSSR